MWKSEEKGSFKRKRKAPKSRNQHIDKGHAPRNRNQHIDKEQVSRNRNQHIDKEQIPWNRKQHIDKRHVPKDRNHHHKNKGVVDYHQYQFSRGEWLYGLGSYMILDGLISYLFYHSMIAFLLILPGVIPFLKEYKRKMIKQRRQKLENEFLDGMQAVSTALAAGYSIENAVAEALQELKRTADDHTMIIRELTQMVVGMSMNRTLEQLFSDLAERSGVKDIESFAQVFAAAKRSGGDLVAIIRNTVKSIYMKEETRQEIMVCLAAKKMEQNVMCLVPFLILFYVRIASPGFLDVLYHNVTGILVMTGCLGIYLLSWMLGKKIVEIEV